MINILQRLSQNNFDQQVAAMFLAQRSDLGITVFTVISFFGDWKILLPVMLIIILILFIKNKKRFIIPFALVVIGAEITTFFGKIWFHHPRPLLAVFHETDFSLPSGHATIAVAFYGYLAYILIKLLKDRYKWPIIILTVLMAGLIGFSRLYLGAHYVSDVLAGYFVGLAALIIGINLNRPAKL
ncbi:MAG: phosphatase PAP2 family protein [bacterium]|nr:phosphatase PAP2 family protein [bacterium]